MTAIITVPKSLLYCIINCFLSLFHIFVIKPQDSTEILMPNPKAFLIPFFLSLTFHISSSKSFEFYILNISWLYLCSISVIYSCKTHHSKCQGQTLICVSFCHLEQASERTLARDSCSISQVSPVSVAQVNCLQQLFLGIRYLH